MTNEVGDTLIITRVAGDARSEALVRALAVASRNLVWVADHALAWGVIRPVAVPAPSVSRCTWARRSGWRARTGGTRPRRSRPPPAAASSSAAASSTFTWEERDGFTWGELELAGEAADAGSSYRIWSKNENLLAWRDGAPDVTAPDLICCLAAETGAPITNPHHAPGALVDVVGVPAAPQWRTAAGVATFGPRRFGFDLDFVPLEDRPHRR